jgi:hypothetical protein
VNNNNNSNNSAGDGECEMLRTLAEVQVLTEPQKAPVVESISRRNADYHNSVNNQTDNIIPKLEDYVAKLVKHDKNLLKQQITAEEEAERLRKVLDQALQAQNTPNLYNLDLNLHDYGRSNNYFNIPSVDSIKYNNFEDNLETNPIPLHEKGSLTGFDYGGKFNQIKQLQQDKIDLHSQDTNNHNNNNNSRDSSIPADSIANLVRSRINATFSDPKFLAAREEVRKNGLPPQIQAKPAHGN